MRRLLTQLCILALVAFGFTSMALAQGSTNATLNGLISDPTGAAIVGASVEIKNVDTGFKVTVETNGSGNYSTTILPPGSYTLTATKSGFKKSVQTGITLTVAQVATVNVSLPLGKVEESVTITANEELINVTTADIGNTINSESVAELPLNGRDPSALVLLAPGMVDISSRLGSTPVGSTQGTNSMNTGNSGNLEWFPSSGGGRQGSTYFNLDGSTNMDNYLLSGLPSPNSDATQEFRVITNGYDAQYGFTPGGVVLIQTKSGTNAIHGGAFEFIRNNDLNAATYFGKQVDGLKRNQFGGYAGGPIIKNKLFFFANVQDTLTNSQARNGSSSFPTTAMLNGDFSALSPCTKSNSSNCLNYNAYSSATNFTQWGGPQAANPIGYGFQATVNGVPNQISTTLWDKSALKFVQNNMPTQTPCASTNLNIPGCQDPVTGQMYFANPATTTKYIENTDRIDWTINDKQRLFIRSYILYLTDVGGSVPGNISASADSQTGELYNETLGHNWMINDTTVNTFTAGFLEEDTLAEQADKQKDGSNFCLSLYMKVSDPKNSCFITFYQWGGGSSNWLEPISQRRTTWSLSDSLAKNAGNLTITGGVDLHKQFSEENTTYPANGLVWGTSSYTGDGFSDLLLGDIGGFSQGGGEVVPLKGWQLGIYAQAQYKLKPNLTVSAGVRWDPDTPPQMVNGYGAVFEPGAQSAMYPNAPAGILFPGDIGVTKSLMPSHLSILEPRFGIVWQPTKLPHTAFRAGFGQFSGPIVYNYYNHAVDIAPFSPEFQPGTVTAQALNLDGTSSQVVGPMSFDSPWTGPAYVAPGPHTPGCPAPCTGTPYSTSAQPDPFQAPNGGFAAASYTPPASTAFATPMATVGESFAPDFQPSITTSWSLSIEHQLTNTLAIHAAYVGSQTDHAMLDVDVNPESNAPGPTYKLRPYSNFSEVDQNIAVGTSPYNALQAGIEKKLSHGIQFQSNYTWSKVLDEASLGSITVANPYDLSWNYGKSFIDVPFNWVTNFVYTTPALKNMNPIARALLGTWQVSTVYTYGAGVTFGVNGALGTAEGSADATIVAGQPFNVHKGGRAAWMNQYFNTKAFTVTPQFQFGYKGRNIFNGPPVSFADSAFSKNWKYSRYTMQLRVDMFNTLNTPSFSAPNSSVNGNQFGAVTGNGGEPPRKMQGDFKFTF
jgi:hypothetical protein